MILVLPNLISREKGLTGCGFLDMHCGRHALLWSAHAASVHVRIRTSDLTGASVGPNSKWDSNQGLKLPTCLSH